MNQFVLEGYLADIQNKKFVPSRIQVRDGFIQSIESIDHPGKEQYIIPGLVDSHIHIESSMMSPQQFSLIAMAHGTVATVSDPHELANVLGQQGIDFMVQSCRRAPLKFYFGVPSCVPATPFETSGAVIDSKTVNELLSDDRFKYLAEMMNFPGVINRDEEVMAKLEAAKRYGKPIDGHAPGVRGNDLSKYAGAGISTDHESGSYEEALEKIRSGMMIQIREGSAAKDFDALMRLVDQFPEQIMLCSDDRHPDDLLEGHINGLILKGLNQGLDFFNLLRAATWNPVKHYNLEVGLLQEGDPADILVIDQPESFNVKSVYIQGEQVYDGNRVLFEPVPEGSPNIMNTGDLSLSDLLVPARQQEVLVIQAHDHQLFTSSAREVLKSKDGHLQADINKDILKIAVLNRYQPQKPAVGFIKNFGLRQGAIGSSIAHDSHNLIVVGVDDQSILLAFQELIRQRGGIVVCREGQCEGLPLEIAGLMTHMPGRKIAEAYTRLSTMAREMGCQLTAPFMTLSFMALPVIPELKITDQGLFDVNKFQYTSIYAEQ